MIKRTVGLRPIKYSKLPSDVTIGCSMTVRMKTILGRFIFKLNIKPTFMNEKDIFINGMEIKM